MATKKAKARKPPLRVSELKPKKAGKKAPAKKKARSGASTDPYSFVSSRVGGRSALRRIQKAAEALLGGVQRRVSDLLGGQNGVPQSKLNPELKRLRREWLKKRLTSAPSLKPSKKKK